MREVYSPGRQYTYRHVCCKYPGVENPLTRRPKVQRYVLTRFIRTAYRYGEEKQDVVLGIVRSPSSSCLLIVHASYLLPLLFTNHRSRVCTKASTAVLARQCIDGNTAVSVAADWQRRLRT